VKLALGGAEGIFGEAREGEVARMDWEDSATAFRA
jgi:hypothetical protein